MAYELLFADSLHGLNSAGATAPNNRFSGSSRTFVVANIFGSRSGLSPQSGFNGPNQTWLSTAAHTEGIVACRGVFSSNAMRATTILDVYGSGTQHLTLCTKSDGALEVRRGTASGTVLATSSAGVYDAADATTPRHFELKYGIDNTNGYIEVRLKKDGDASHTVVIPMTTGLDTQNDTSANVGFVQWYNSWASTGGFFRVGDFYLLADTGVNHFSDYLGAAYCLERRPNSDSSVQFTRSSGASNWSLVDEGVADGADYVHSATPGHRDKYGHSGGISDNVRVLAAMVEVTAYKESADDGAITPLIESGSTVALGNELSLAPTTWTYYRSKFVKNPDGDVDWTPAAINAVKFGQER